MRKIMFNSRELCMKLIKNLMLVVLLATSSNVFAKDSFEDFFNKMCKDIKKIADQLNKNCNKLIDRMKSNGTSFDKDMQGVVDQLRRDYKEFMYQRNEMKKNGTSFEKASIVSIDIVLDAIPVALSVGACSYVVDGILESFDTTKDMPNRGVIATRACLALYIALYASFKYEEMQKSEEEQISFYDWLVNWVK